MKNIYFILITMLVSASTLAQVSLVSSASKLKVENQTPCYQYFVIAGGEPCTCGGLYASNIIAIAPYSSLSFLDSTTLGGSFPPGAAKGIVGAKILNGSPVCSSGGGSVGQAACGHPSSYAFLALSSNCIRCAYTKANWIQAPNCSDGAALVFTF